MNLDISIDKAGEVLLEPLQIRFLPFPKIKLLTVKAW